MKSDITLDDEIDKLYKNNCSLCSSQRCTGDPPFSLGCSIGKKMYEIDQKKKSPMWEKDQ